MLTIRAYASSGRTEMPLAFDREKWQKGLLKMVALNALTSRSPRFALVRSKTLPLPPPTPLDAPTNDVSIRTFACSQVRRFADSQVRRFADSHGVVRRAVVGSSQSSQSSQMVANRIRKAVSVYYCKVRKFARFARVCRKQTPPPVRQCLRSRILLKPYTLWRAVFA